ncbi:MAG: DUF2513 domain-containing protein [Phycisphaerales bacterium]|nr:DUF2513 domain-containing protein [Phycisphaerales bacterium]
MKRDMDLCRLILVEAEKLPPSPLALNEPIEIPGHEYDVIVEHIRILADDGMVEAQDWSTMDGVDWRIERLTSRGHDFLAAARDDTLWRRAKVQLGPKIATVGLKVVGDVLSQLARAPLVQSGFLPP